MDDRNVSGQFVAGNNGGGRCPGAGNKPKVEKLAAVMAQEQLAALLGKAVAAVEAELSEGSEHRLRAAELVLKKLMPDARPQPETIELPALGDAGLYVRQKLAAINAAVGSGQLSIADGERLSWLVMRQTDAIDVLTEAVGDTIMGRQALEADHER